MNDCKKTMLKGAEFIARNLRACVQEELAWQSDKNGILGNGKLREAAAIYAQVDVNHAMQIVQSEVTKQAMKAYIAAPLHEAGNAAAVQDPKAAFEEWAEKDGTYDLRPYNWKVISVGGIPYDGYVRPYKQDRTVYAYQGFVAGLTAAAAPSIAAPTEVERDAVEGDLLPAVGEKVRIHLARENDWIEHTVTGYYVWPAHPHQIKPGQKDAHRVFVRVKDEQGYDNARLLSEVRRAAIATREKHED